MFAFHFPMQYIDYMSNFSWSKKAFVKDVIQLDELVVIQDRKHWNKKMRYILQSQDLSFPYFLSRNSYYFCVLVFTGTGLIFSTVAGTMLCSGFRVKAEAVSHGCFHCCWAMPTQNQGHIFFPRCPSSKEAGMHKVLWRDTARTADLSWPKGVMHRNKSQEKRGRKSAFGSDGVYTPKKLLDMRSTAFLELAEYQPADSKNWMGSLRCLACTHSFCFT